MRLPYLHMKSVALILIFPDKILPLACLSVLLLLDDFGVSTWTKLGIEVATLDGLGFRGDDLSLILTPG